MARKTRKKDRKKTAGRITLTDTGKKLVATMPGPKGGYLVISKSADLKAIRALIKQRQQIGEQISQMIADKGLQNVFGDETEIRR